ncbi:hypothetical protein V9T40_001143 [Parthenolecanium corni]|uniref:Zinc finger CCCH-type with G patch domain-containing protein n=1 Tax=Parthenolecanium corni TaxID=536013 RepID=A0AAN9Y131_9HEMI
MAENRDALEESLRLYETQLEQVIEALSSDGSSEELILLQENLQELITLTKESLDSSKSERNNDDPLAEEYALFKAELENEISNEDDESAEADESLQDELNCLVGSKCRAPFSEKWSDGANCSYHNALIMSIDSSDSLDNVKVKVLFVNPTCQEMLPCPYFLDGECRFSDIQCRFCHGHDVNFADLKEYMEPDFSALKEKTTVLAKDNDNLWKRATITALILENNQCCVRFDSGHKQDVIIDIHNTLPLGKSEESSTYEDQQSKRVEKDYDFKEHQAMLVEKTLTEPAPSAKLGEWEKYTNSIGSKLMASMGYIAGTGLGKHGEGRLEPITATVLPPGKSLDHCMELREAAGGDPNLFNAEKLQKKIKRKMLANLRNKKKRAAVQEQKSNDVFSFLNKSIAGNSSPQTTSTEDDALLKQSSTKALNVKELKICGDMQKKDYELMVLREKLSRQKSNTVGHNTLKKKINVLESELNTMRSKLNDVYKEKNYRQTLKELTEF